MQWTLNTHTLKGIFEIDLKERGVRVSAFDVRFPKQESQSANANEHDNYLKKCC
jgi:hypothetical protein